MIVALAAGVLLLAAADMLHAAVPVVTVLADFEDEAVAASLGELENILPTDCELRRRPVLARGQACLALDIGATALNVSVACNLRFREPLRFQQADRVAAFYWLKKGEFQLAFRIRDGRGQVFESKLQTIRTRNRWVRVGADLDPAKLRRVRGDGPLTWPIEIHGYRVTTGRLGKQTVLLDDLLVEHRVKRREMIRGEFIFDQPTRIYEPGSTVGAAIRFENRSRDTALRLSVELAWTRPDGSVLKTQRATITLPASGRDFRSRQSIDFSQRIDQPGLYRLVARARADNWSVPSVFETSVAVTPCNRLLPRGRSTFFGVGADLLHEPPADQRLEIDIARDIGVHLLAFHVPWRTIEPAVGHFDFTALDPIVDALVQKDIAPLIVLTDPPVVAPTGPERLARLTTLLTRLAGRYGPSVSHYQLTAETVGETDPGELGAALQKLQEEIRKIQPNVRLISPPLPADSAQAARKLPELSQTDSGLNWSFRTSGPSSGALADLREFRQRRGITWRDSHWWQHQAAPLAGPTHFVDAEAVLRHYVQAALAGVAGVIWYDLRDNDNDPARPELMRGLMRRDFSPKASLLGYASGAGMLTGLSCRGPVLGTPPEFESALFIGSERQVAVLLPKPNRIRPALLAPIQGVPGEFEIRDFERRKRSLQSSAGPPVVATIPRPFFVTLPVESAQPEPQIAFVEPWLRVPATVFCGDDQPFIIELDAATDVRRGFLRLVPAPDAPFTVTPARRAFRAEEGETRRFPIRLSPSAGEAFERSTLTLKVALGDRKIQVPIEVRPIVEIQRRPRSATLTSPEYRLGTLAAPEGRRASAEATVFASYEPRRLHLTVVIDDDRFIPLRAASGDAVSGDDLLLGVALENADVHVEVRADTSPGAPALLPAHGTPPERLRGWHCRTVRGEEQNARVCEITIPAGALGVGRLEPGTRVLLALRYVDDDADGLAPMPLQWGRGLDGSRSAEGFRWARLRQLPRP